MVTAAQTQLDLYQSVTQNAKQVATQAQEDAATRHHLNKPFSSW